MANIELAKAYVTIVPSMQGAQQQITEELTGAGSAAGEQAGQAAGGGFSRALGVAAQVGVAAVTAAATGIGALTTQAVESYANYEQLTGGIETLYGEASAQMMEFAQNAASTTGQSMNEFMESAISTSAAMISAVEGDQARAAELTNMAMIDMADNANRLGTDMESVQNAYRGFSRGNFTMLDNLALGFAGTKEGMEELLAQATELSGVEYDIDSYADIVEAIHVVQTEMGIAGATAEEASGTISGSIGALAASWENLITGIADPNADLGSLIDNLVVNAETALENLPPVVTNALSGIATAIGTLAPIIASALPPLVQEITPPLLSAAADILKALTQGLIMALPSLAPVAAETVVDLVRFLIDNIGLIIDSAVQMVIAITLGIAQALPELIPAAVSAVVEICNALISNINLLVDAALQLAVALGEGLVNATPEIVAGIPSIISSIMQAFGQLGGYLLQGAAEWAADLIDGLVSGITNGISRVQGAVSSVAQGIRDFIGFSEPERGPLSDFHTYMPDMFDMLEEGIEDEAPDFEATLNRSLSMPSISAYSDFTAYDPDTTADVGGDFIIPINIGQERLDTIMIKSSQLAMYRRGS